MELVKNIFFNTDRLIAGNTVKISYTGLFFQDKSQKAFIWFWRKLGKFSRSRNGKNRIRFSN